MAMSGMPSPESRHRAWPVDVCADIKEVLHLNGVV